MVWLEPYGHEDSEYVFIPISWHVCEQNGNTKHLTTPAALTEVGETVAHRWLHVIGIAEFQEFHKKI